MFSSFNKLLQFLFLKILVISFPSINNLDCANDVFLQHKSEYLFILLVLHLIRDSNHYNFHHVKITHVFISQNHM